MNQPGDFESIDPPCEAGTEFIRAAIDSEGMLMISIKSAPLLSDVRLWGIALADIAKSVSKFHAVAETMHSHSFDESCERGDNADALLALEMIRQQFSAELSFGYSGLPAATVDYPLQLPEPVPLAALSKGDRFVHEGRWYVIITSKEDYTVAVDLVTGDVAEFSSHVESHPVRRSTSASLSATRPETSSPCP